MEVRHLAFMLSNCCVTENPGAHMRVHQRRREEDESKTWNEQRPLRSANTFWWEFCLTLKMSHGGSGRGPCSAWDVTDPDVGSSAWVGHKVRRQERGARKDGVHRE